jgi:hypothetical protein
VTLTRNVAALTATLSAALAAYPTVAAPPPADASPPAASRAEPEADQPPPDVPLNEPPSRQPPGRTVWLEQGWGADERAWYHHASQGTATFGVPYEWFVALEQPRLSIDSPGLLGDPDYLDRFGFIRSPRSAEHNPDGLPVGFARSGPAFDPSTGRAWTNPATGETLSAIGLTCAGCHTGQIDYRGTRIVVDGGPAMTDLDGFRDALAWSLFRATASPLAFRRFADRVLGGDHGLRAELALWGQLLETVKRGREAGEVEKERAAGSVEEGFGRLDALNRIGNEVFSNRLREPANFAPRTAPVAYPHIWGTPWFDWVQYDGSIQQPMVRNAGEALGVRALVNLTNRERPLFASTVPFENLAGMEELLAGEFAPPGGPEAPRGFPGLGAPAWPEDVLPPIDRALAERGQGLYGELCQGCHMPPVGTAAFWDQRYWTEPDAGGRRYLKMPLFAVDEIGTDPAQAEVLGGRTVRVPAYLGLEGGTGAGPALTYKFGPALGGLVGKTVVAWYDRQTPPVPPEQRERMNGYRPNGIRAERSYKARPLDGIWATPPYLHNGSVPDLYALLSPVAERPSRFFLGGREFDPVRVGYRSEPLPGGFELDTGVAGNSNAGHAFDDGPRGGGIIGRRLSPEERRALVEYLKTL